MVVDEGLEGLGGQIVDISCRSQCGEASEGQSIVAHTVLCMLCVFVLVDGNQVSSVSGSLRFDIWIFGRRHMEIQGPATANVASTEHEVFVFHSNTSSSVRTRHTSHLAYSLALTLDRFCLHS